MSKYFPHHTDNWKIEEPPAFRRLSLSLLEMAAITGIVLRLYRSVALTHAPSDSWVYLGATFAAGAIFLAGMTTLHLGNFPLRQWTWRAPAFAAVEAVAESLTSLALISLRREPLGTSRAAFSDWPRIALDVLFWRLTTLIIFAVVLAGVVQLVRYALLRRDHRTHTVDAVHDEIVRQAEAREG